MSTVIQRDHIGFTTSPATLTLTGCVAGNSVCVMALHSYTGTPPSAAITNTTGLVKHVNNLSSGGFHAHAWEAKVAANGNCVVTLTYGAGQIYIAFASEVSGIDATTPYGGNSVAATSSSASVSAGTVTPTVNGSYLMYIGQLPGTSAWTPPSGFTEVRDDSNYTAADFVQTTAAAITPTATSDTSANNNGWVVFFNAAAGGGGAVWRPYY